MMKKGLLMTALLMSMVPSAMAAEPVEYTHWILCWLPLPSMKKRIFIFLL